VSQVLAPEHRRLLTQFARSKVLLAFDFDGTLAPIVDHPLDAAMRPETLALLQRVSRIYPCAVISGRATADVRSRLQGSGISRVVGNHGADFAGARAVRKSVAQWNDYLVQHLADLQGVWIEDKGLSLAVHYRKSGQRTELRERMLLAAKELTGARITSAIESVNVVFAAAPNKGDALEMLRQESDCERVIFVGDDQTDEDVFTRDWGGALMGIRVGGKKSAAEFRLADQFEIDRLLTVLADLREPSRH